MSPEVAVDRIQSFLRWNSSSIDALDADHEPIANPACYRRGEGGKREYWITAATWRDILFCDSADESRQFAGMRKNQRQSSLNLLDQAGAVPLLRPLGLPETPFRGYRAIATPG